MKEVVLIVGMPGSGKTTSVEQFVQRGYVRLNRDEIGGHTLDLCGKMINLLNQGKSVVLDNTFCTVGKRAPFIIAAHTVGAKIRAIAMETSIEDCGYNICQRMIRKYDHLLSPEEIKKSNDPNIFPPAVLFKFRKEYVAPTTLEGFDAVESVSFERKPIGYTNKALILDKDGTLTESICGDKYPCTVADVKILEGRAKKIKEYKDKGYLLLGVSNQSGIAKGTLTVQTLDEILTQTNKLLGLPIEWAYCPHKIPPISCWCRKPMSGLGVHFIESHKLDPAQCIFTGDMTTDATFAKRCGFQFIHSEEFFKV